MAEQRAPNLEEMNEQEAHRFLVELFSNLSAQEEYELRHQDYVMEMPQSGESIRGRDKMREFRKPTPLPHLSGYAECSLGMGCGWSKGSTITAVGRYSTWCYSSN
jgi:hypothetical protein